MCFMFLSQFFVFVLSLSFLRLSRRDTSVCALEMMCINQWVYTNILPFRVIHCIFQNLWHALDVMVDRMLS